MARVLYVPCDSWYLVTMFAVYLKNPGDKEFNNHNERGIYVLDILEKHFRFLPEDQGKQFLRQNEEKDCTLLVNFFANVSHSRKHILQNLLSISLTIYPTVEI